MKGGWLRAVVCGSLGFAALQACAAVVPVGPFSGTMSEGWESFPEYSWGNSPVGPFLGSPTPIMGGAASITGPELLCVYRRDLYQSWWGLGSSGVAQVADGVKGLGIDTYIGWMERTMATIAWTTPVVQFGAYFGAPTQSFASGLLDDPAIINVGFYDPAGVLVDTEALTYSHSDTGDGGLDWHGWSFSSPVGSVSIEGYQTVVDGLQATAVPEPTACGLLGLGTAALLAARRRGRRAQS